MVKPANALQGSVAADLSQLALENAMNEIVEHLNEQYGCPIHISYEVKGNLPLFTYSKDFLHVAGVPYMYEPTYGVDEWSLKGTAIFNTKEIVRITYWSPGA